MPRPHVFKNRKVKSTPGSAAAAAAAAAAAPSITRASIQLPNMSQGSGAANGNGNVKSETQYLTAEQVEKLQRDPQNRIYEYEYDQVNTVIPADQVWKMVQDIRTIYMDLCTNPSGTSDADIREYILTQENPAFRTFAIKTHTKLFEYVTSRNCNMDMVKFMIDLKNKETKTGMKDEHVKAELNQYLYQKLDTGLTVEEYQAKMKAEEEAAQGQGAEASDNGAPLKFGLSTAPEE
jgi:hypothetical protein